MIVDGYDNEGRWEDVKMLLERNGPFAHPDFEPGTDVFDMMRDIIKILVIGAGGLGCELLKDIVIEKFICCIPWLAVYSFFL